MLTFLFEFEARRLSKSYFWWISLSWRCLRLNSWYSSPKKLFFSSSWSFCGSCYSNIALDMQSPSGAWAAAACRSIEMLRQFLEPAALYDSCPAEFLLLIKLLEEFNWSVNGCKFPFVNLSVFGIFYILSESNILSEKLDDFSIYFLIEMSKETLLLLSSIEASP